MNDCLCFVFINDKCGIFVLYLVGGGFRDLLCFGMLNFFTCVLLLEVYYFKFIKLILKLAKLNLNLYI